VAVLETETTVLEAVRKEVEALVDVVV